MTPDSSADVNTATERAIARLRSSGIDGPPPAGEIDTLNAFGNAVAAALDRAVREAPEENLWPAFRLVALLRCSDALGAVHAAAFEGPAALAAKREAVAAFAACGVDPDREAQRYLSRLEELLASADAAALQEAFEWPPAWRAPAVREVLAAAPADVTPAVGELLGRDGDVDAELVDWLGAHPTPEAAAALQAYIAAAGDRQQIKQAKRALHRVRSQGVSVEEPSGGAAAGKEGFSMSIESHTLADARAYATSIDGRGSRLVWVLWRAAGGGSRLLQAVLDDTLGIKEAEVAVVTRNGFREYIEQMQANDTVLLDQVEVPRAFELLGAAAAVTRGRDADLPEAYGEWLKLLGDAADTASGATVDTTATPRIYNALDAEQLRSDASLIDEAMKLLREPHFQSWALEGKVIEDAADAVRQAEDSTLMVSDEQRRERMQDAIKDAVHASFDDATRRQYRSRLEVMAEVLWGRGDEEAARQALAAAIGLTEVNDLYHGHAMARALVHRGVWLAYQDRRRDETAAEQANLAQP